MMNVAIFEHMVDEYNRLSFAHDYIFGYEYNGMIYATVTTEEDVYKVCTLDRASRGAGFSLRYKPTVSQKALLMERNMTPICSVKFFNEEVTNSKYNRGEIFEKMVTEYFGQEWHKDNVSFAKDGDITIDGIAYQIKFNKATFCNEQTLANLN